MCDIYNTINCTFTSEKNYLQHPHLVGIFGSYSILHGESQDYEMNLISLENYKQFFYSTK